MSYSGIEIKSQGKFLKIENGTTHQLRILNEDPAVKTIHGFGPTQASCTGEGCFRCMENKEGDEPKQRFMTNIYNHTLGRVMVWEFGPNVGRQLKEIDASLRKEDSDITRVDLKVSSSGSGMQKKYMVMPWASSKPVPPSIQLHRLTSDEVPF